MTDPITRVAQRWAAPSQRADFVRDIKQSIGQTLTWHPATDDNLPREGERVLVAVTYLKLHAIDWRDAHVDEDGVWRDCDDAKPMHCPGVSEVTHWARVPMPDDSDKEKART